MILSRKSLKTDCLSGETFVDSMGDAIGHAMRTVSEKRGKDLATRIALDLKKQLLTKFDARKGQDRYVDFHIKYESNHSRFCY